VSERPTPFAVVFGGIANERFPAIAEALRTGGASSEGRDAFVLVEPVARLLQDLAPAEASPDELEAHLRLLHHAYRHWTAGGWLYRVGEATLARVAAGGRISSRLPRQALYLQVPAGKVWRPPVDDAPAEPLDGLFVTETDAPGEVALLAVFGMHRGRAGFSAVALEGRADEDDAARGELEVAAARPDGSAAFAPLLGGTALAGLYSVVTAGELLLLTCRLLALLPAGPDETAGDAGGSVGVAGAANAVERIVPV
jgi:hypothetical protein